MKNDESDNSKVAIRGAPLREFSRFLAIKDPDCTFSGLGRVLTDDGMCCWTTQQGAERIQTDADEEEFSEIPSMNQREDFAVAEVEAKAQSMSTPLEAQFLEALKQQQELQQASLAHLLAIQNKMMK
jgi:hypothetical protein